MLYFTGQQNGKMLFNVDKCKVMHFGKHSAHYDYTLNNKSLVKVTEERDLGIVISGDLKVSQQCSQAYSKASKLLGVLNRSIVYKSKDTMLKLYKNQ